MRLRSPARRRAPLPATPAARSERNRPDLFYQWHHGLPKGVCLSHENLVCSALDSVETLELTRADAWLHAAPMLHLVDAFASWGVTLAGGRHVTAHFEPDLFGPLVQDGRI